MVDSRDLPPRMRRAGLLASIVAVVAVGVTVIADNHDAGFGHTVTHRGQMVLFAIASLLLAAQTIAYVIDRVRRRRAWIGRAQRPPRTARRIDPGEDYEF